MNVVALQEYLNSLTKALIASRAPDNIVRNLREAASALDPFTAKSLSEFTEFLVRARDYERDGHLPKVNPPINGQVVDMPTPDELAHRVQAFLRKNVPANGPMSELVAGELNNLKGFFKLPQLKQLAAACGVTGSMKSAQTVIEKTFEQITGRRLADALMDTYQDMLVRSKDNERQLGNVIAKIESSCNLAQLKKLAKQLGINTTVKSKSDGIEKIRLHLSKLDYVSGNNSLPVESTSDEKIRRIVETLQELKVKAHPDDAPESEINEELQRLENELGTNEAIAVANKFGVKSKVFSKADAMKKIHDEVFESKLIREKIRY